MELLCIDPGPKESGMVVYDGKNVIEVWPSIENDRALKLLNGDYTDHLSIEMVSSFGMPVGRDVFETVLWIGRFIQAYPWEHTKVYRKDVKMALCQSARAKDANIRQAILDRFPVWGGGKTPQVGTKKEPGPLYGVSKHAWAALAVGIAWFEKNYSEVVDE